MLRKNTGGTDARYVLDVDTDAAVVTVGSREDLFVAATPLASWRWTGAPPDGPIVLQCSAHGPTAAGTIADGCVRWAGPHRRIAPGQSVVAYVDEPGVGEIVVGGGIAARHAVPSQS